MSNNGLEFNKIAAGVLIAGLVAMVAGKVADGLYHPKPAEKRGFEVAALEESAGAGATAKEPVKLGALLAAANAENGKVIAKKCATCHSFENGGANMVGPNLWAVVGAAKGAHSGFDYSPALKEKGGNWDYEALYHFVYSPKGYVKGTKMAFAGLRKPEEIADLIAFMRSMGGGSPLPPADFEVAP
jgi:cytochrome c